MILCVCRKDCTVVSFTNIEEWYKNNTYIPYSWDSQTNLILKVKSLIFPWIRLNRIVRDIPGSDYDSSPERIAIQRNGAKAGHSHEYLKHSHYDISMLIDKSPSLPVQMKNKYKAKKKLMEVSNIFEKH
jgi:histone acetyltransferase (RNA polymerase elongator complex component)